MNDNRQDIELPKQPLVSVIVPAFNAEKFLGECVDSVLAQTFRNIELIIVDDASTDSTAAISRQYAETDNRVIPLSITHAGLSGARNAGINRAGGRYLLFADADDTLHPCAIETMVDAANTSNADIVIAPFVAAASHTFDDSRIEPTYKPIDAFELVEHTLYQKIANTQWGKLFNRRLFNRISPFKLGIHYEDLEFSYRAYFAASGIIILNTPPLYFYRQHGESFMQRWSLSHLDLLGVVDQIEDFAISEQPTLVRAARVRKFCANYSICLMAASNGETKIAGDCWTCVRSYRKYVLFNHRVRVKDTLGACLSLFGKKTCIFISRCIGKY